MNITGLVRITVAAPQRRLDLVVPEQASVAEVLPGILAKAGEHLADAGVPDGGWVLRDADGIPLSLGRTIGSHRLKDGQILHLLPQRTDWPEPEYDDLVDAVATGSSRLGAPWSPWHTRIAGLTAAALAVLTILVTTVGAGAPWGATAGWLLLMAMSLTAAGVVLARVVGDSGAGAVLGGLALVFGFLGGGLLLAGNQASPTIGAPQLLTGSVTLVVVGLACYVGVVDGSTMFAGAVCAGVFGAIAAWLATADSLTASDAAAVTAAALLAFSPLFGGLAVRIGRLPMPILPRSTADLVRDDPQPPRRIVYAAVVRSDAILTGILIGFAIVFSVCLVELLHDQTRSAVVLTLLLSAGCLLRARLYPIVRQRLTLLTPGLLGPVGVVIGPLAAAQTDPVLVITPLMVALGGLLVFLGLWYSSRPPNPYLGRMAELIELFVVLALIPVACAVVGLYGVVRGLGG